MSDSTTSPAEWHPDPSGRFELRYWDGSRWTEHVSTAGHGAVDHAGASPVPMNTSMRDATHVPLADVPDARVEKQLARAGAVDAAFAGDGTVFGESVLVVNQKAKLVELNNEYAVLDSSGRQIAAVRQVGQSTARKVLRLVTKVDQYLTHKLQLCDMEGRVLLDLVRPAKVFKSTVLVSSPERGEIGKLVQENVIGKIHFGIEVGGRRIGSINAENWRAWNFSIRDENEQEVARITKTFAGLLRASFTTADNYVVQVHRPMEEPLRSLVVAAAVCVDTALKQDDR